MQACGIVAGGEIESYGEVHAQYKQTFCAGLEGGVQYPEPHHISQPPYVAVNRSHSGDEHNFFWSSLRNQLMVPFAGQVNNLIQVAFIETAWEIPSADPLECGQPQFDVVFCANSETCADDSRFWIFTVKLFIEDYPRPFEGFTDRDGLPAPECIGASHDCIPLMIDAGVPDGNVFFNRPVMPDITEFLDYSEPGLYMPGGAP